MHQKIKRLPLKTVYYLVFVILIVVPLLAVLLTALYVLNHQFKKQAIENIERAQENIVTELTSDIEVMSMRLSHLIYTNDNEVIDYAAGTDTDDVLKKYDYEQLLSKAGNLALEPVKNIVAVGFYMKSGREMYIKSSLKRSYEEISRETWYQAALQKPNAVCLGSYDTLSANDLYTGGKKDSLVLVFALSPDVTTDRSQKVEMVAFYQISGAGDTIKAYDQGYLNGKNKLGITQIVDETGALVFSTVEGMEFSKREYTCVRTPLEFDDTVWYVESYIKTNELTKDFWRVARIILLAAVVVFLMAGYYSGYFLKSIVHPIAEINQGLKQVEEGNLDVHVVPQGQFEIRSMIHQFNAMVRRLKALIEEYEEKSRSMAKKPADYFNAIMKKELTPQEVSEQSKEFFADKYALLFMQIENYPQGKNDMESARNLVESFEHNPRFAARCLIYKESLSTFVVFYRILEEDYVSGISQMLVELQGAARKIFGVKISACIGKEMVGPADFVTGLEEIRSKRCLHFLYGEESIVSLTDVEEKADKIISGSEQYKKLAEALYVADEKNLVEEREKLFDLFSTGEREEIETQLYAAILAIGKRFDTDNESFFDIFEKQYNYIEKIERLEDLRSLKLWVTNYFGWIMEYSSAKLNIVETDAIVKAKRYITDNYEDADLSLAKVADYVGLNEKYFTNRFSKETGETFSSYLTALRIQKAKELLKTTTFKVYEISEMVGYHNVEHFNRMFKKLNGISPAQYRKTM